MLESTVSQQAKILTYTRKPVDGEYPSHLAFSAHFAISRDGLHFEALNRNYGMLYASSTIGADNTIHEKGLKKPWLFPTADGFFGVVAVRVIADGSPDEESRGKILLWTSPDLCKFSEAGLVDLGLDSHVAEVMCCWDADARLYRIDWRDDHGNTYQNTLPDSNDPRSVSKPKPSNASFGLTSFSGYPEGAVCGNSIAADASFCDRLALRWTPLTNVAVRVPDTIRVSSAEEFAAVKAVAVYSDGSTSLKSVQWDASSIDFSQPGEFDIGGTVLNEQYAFPLARGYADPDVLKWGGKWYFIATNDNTNAVGFYVREAETVHGLFADDIQEHMILGRDESRGFTKCFWAPEFHVIGGSLYILCALGGEGWGPQCHMMRLKPGGSITDPDGWETPVRVRKADGSWLTDDGITLDMTSISTNGKTYLVWSYRMNLFTPLDTGSMLYISETCESEPWMLASEPVLLSRPLLGWENIEHTINNEGPYAFVTDGTIYLAFSGGAAGGYTYAIGLLTAKTGSDLLDPASWAKSCAPVLSHYSMEGEYGPGHNSFFTDNQGNLMIAYHAQEALSGTPRCTAIRRVHFNINSEPVFDLSAERDLDPKLSKVRARVSIAPAKRV